jgi:membrane-bound ClpP family serine protease
MDPLVWAALLLLLGLSLAVLEIFVPSGGMLGFLSVLAILAAIILGFTMGGALIGTIFLLLAAVGVPVSLGLGFHYWPHTPMGRRILLDIPTSEQVLPDSEERRALRELIGKLGRAKSVMLPSGAVLIDGRIIDAVSEGQAIEEGQTVRVIEVHGTRIVVRPADEPQQTGSPTSEDLLSRPIESLGLDSIDDPLA